MKKIKILYVKNGDFVKGGVETFIYNHYKFIDKNIFQLDFLIFSDSPNRNSEEVKFYQKFGSNVYFAPTRNRNLNQHLKAVNLVLQDNYTIIHTHTGPSAGITMMQAKKQGIPIRIAHSHGTKPKGNVKMRTRLNWTLLEVMKSLVKNYATDYFSCSSDAGAYLFGRNNLERVIQIKNAIDIVKYKYSEMSRLEIRKSLKISKDSFVLGQIGRFDDNKNQNFTLNILKELCEMDDNFVLIYIGTGEKLSQVKEKAVQLKLSDKIRFIEKTSEVNRYLSSMDLLIFPSKHEGLPLVLVEAQAANLPIVASKNISEEIKMNSNLTFLDLNDQSKWIKQILVHYSNLNTDRSTRPDALYINGYDINDSGEKLNAKYLELLEERDGKDGSS